jgi:LmbE family N-acetylglucosaminyl deacetylase
MKLLGFNKVLCLSPHPDDVEYSMLGTILKYTDTEFSLLQLAQGGDCDETTGEHRLREVEKVWQVAGCHNLKIINTQYKFIKEITEENWIRSIETIIKNSDIIYDAIFLPNETDSHFEHRFVSGFGAALIRNSKINLIQYYTPSTQDAWRSNFYIDIEPYYEKKLQALKMFESQQHRYYFTENVLRAFHSDFQCSKKKLHYVEKYKILNLFN